LKIPARRAECSLTENARSPFHVEPGHQATALEKVDQLFTRKFLNVAGAILGCFSIGFGAVTFLQGKGVTGTALGWVELIAGFGTLFVVYLLAQRKNPK
jgi:hypothetical protein